MAMTAKTKAERTARLEARIEKIQSHRAGLTKRIASLDADEAAAKAELEWVKSAPVSDGNDQESLPVEVERVVVPAASPAEVASAERVANSRLLDGGQAAH